MAAPDPAAPEPRAFRVDDFAFRRGQRYGTLLIDCETGAPLDLIEGRAAGPLADWLAAHPGIEVICRDRSGSYAEGARTGAPQAVQVADRFHLWQNLAKAVERCAAAHRACLDEPASASPACPEPAPPPEPAPAARPDPAGKYADRARRHHATVHGLLAEGCGLRQIARHLGWGLHTVQRYARAATWQELADGRWQGPRPSKLDPFKPYLDQHADGSRGSIARLFREIQALGCDGSCPVVRDYLDQHGPARAPLPPASPTVRDLAGWITRRPDSLTQDEQTRLTAVLDRCPELQAASDQVRAFAVMITRLTGQGLAQWTADARDAALPGISSFAKGLEQDIDAVTLGLTTRWNSGPAEGRVNHIKMIKRQMFGRAGLPLLRKRVLLTAQNGPGLTSQQIPHHTNEVDNRAPFKTLVRSAGCGRRQSRVPPGPLRGTRASLGPVATRHSSPRRPPTTAGSPPRPPTRPRPGLPQLRNRSREPRAATRRPAQARQVSRSRESSARNTR